jgi:hypothetical protein
LHRIDLVARGPPYSLCVCIFAAQLEPGIMSDSDDDFEGRRNVRGRRSRRGQVEDDVADAEEKEEEEEEDGTAEGDVESGSEGGEVSPNTPRFSRTYSDPVRNAANHAKRPLLPVVPIWSMKARLRMLSVAVGVCLGVAY